MLLTYATIAQLSSSNSLGVVIKQGHRHKSRALVRENVKTCENL